MRFASLGSGSRGNGTLVEYDQTTLLVDLGFSVREAEKRLQKLGRTPEDIDAILVTHEHSDHIQGVPGFARKYDLPVYLTHGTGSQADLSCRTHVVNIHRSFELGDILVEPVAVPHDAREPCQYIFSANNMRIGILTDLGHVSSHVRESYASCDALVLETNHDEAMLKEGPYPWPLKQRVGGDLGHLSNFQAGTLLESMDLDRLRFLLLSHLSEQNNQPALVMDAIEPLVRGRATDVRVSEQNTVTGWIDLIAG